MLEDDSFQATLGYQTMVPVMMIENENSVAGRQVASDTVTTVAGLGTGSQRNYQCLPSARLHWSYPTLGPEEVSHLQRGSPGRRWQVSCSPAVASLDC